MRLGTTVSTTITYPPGLDRRRAPLTPLITPHLYAVELQSHPPHMIAGRADGRERQRPGHRPAADASGYLPSVGGLNRPSECGSAGGLSSGKEPRRRWNATRGARDAELRDRGSRR